MLFRTINGEVIEIKRENFLSCKDYNKEIIRSIFHEKKTEQYINDRDELQYILDIVKDK